MRRTSVLATSLAALALTAGPALADKPHDPGTTGHQHAQHSPGHAKAPATHVPGGAHAKRKAYGRYCADQSKRHVAGQKGTAFSRCVTAMAKLAHGDARSAKAACKTLSKKHVKGHKGTPHSRCIVAAAKLKHHPHEHAG